MKIVISQMKPYLGNLEKNLEKMINNIEEGIGKGGDIIVFPELSLTGTVLQDGVFDNYISNIPEKLMELSKKISIIFGAIEEKENRLYNTAFILEDGKVIGKHRKIFLSHVNGVSEKNYYSKGKNINVFNSKLGKIGVTLGEEALNGFVKEILSNKGAEINFNLANISVVEDMEIYEGALIADSYYNKNFNVFVNRVGVEDGVIFTGNSFVSSPDKKIIEKIEKINEKLSIIDINLNTVKRETLKTFFDKEENLEIIEKELKNLKEN